MYCIIVAQNRWQGLKSIGKYERDNEFKIEEICNIYSYNFSCVCPAMREVIVDRYLCKLTQKKR